MGSGRRSRTGPRLFDVARRAMLQLAAASLAARRGSCDLRRLLRSRGPSQGRKPLQFEVARKANSPWLGM